MTLTAEQVDVLLRPIAKHRVQILDGNSYVETHDVRAMLIRVFGFAGWSLAGPPPELIYETEHKLNNGKDGYKVAYRASVVLTILATGATYAGSAVAESIMPTTKRGDAHDMALKSAESGALKRAAINLGDQFGLSLYNGGSLGPFVKRIVGHDTSPATAHDDGPAVQPETPPPTTTPEPEPEPVGPLPTDTPATMPRRLPDGFSSEAQQRAILRSMHAALGKIDVKGGKEGTPERVEYLRFLRGAAGRQDILSSNELSYDEVNQVINMANTERRSRLGAHH